MCRSGVDLECRLLHEPGVDFRHCPLDLGGSQLLQPEPLARGSSPPVSQRKVSQHRRHRISVERGCYGDAFVRAPPASHAPAQVGAMGHYRWIWRIDSHLRRESAAAWGEGNARKNLATARIDVPSIVRGDILALWSGPSTATMVAGHPPRPWSKELLVHHAGIPVAL